MSVHFRHVLDGDHVIPENDRVDEVPVGGAGVLTHVVRYRVPADCLRLVRVHTVRVYVVGHLAQQLPQVVVARVEFVGERVLGRPFFARVVRQQFETDGRPLQHVERGG